MSACRAGVAIAKYWKGCGLSIKHSQPETATWSCVFNSARLASAMACDGLQQNQQHNHFVCPSAGERESRKR